METKHLSLFGRKKCLGQYMHAVGSDDQEKEMDSFTWQLPSLVLPPVMARSVFISTIQNWSSQKALLSFQKHTSYISIHKLLILTSFLNLTGITSCCL